eukprot:gb/GECH01009972.1/.p1 GENE.gb/GECH01009972.1/~~gb/GECH01009972.1/.p1  ORF type:complete len:221 (+),score=42.75 gb/GECH01009972.1/:1-663(+)
MLDDIASVIKGSVGAINLVITIAETVSKDDPKAQKDVIQMKKDFQPLIDAFSEKTENTFNEALNKFSDISLSDNVKNKMDQNGINVSNIVTCLQAVVAVINSFKSIDSGTLKEENKNNSKQNETPIMDTNRNTIMEKNMGDSGSLKEKAEKVQKAEQGIQQEAQCNQKVEMATKDAYHSFPNISLNNIKTSPTSPQSHLSSSKIEANPQQETRQNRPMTQ